jgi:hypothetical protein
MATKVYVDSVVYNLAGEEANRPDFLKSLVVRNVLSGSDDSMAETLQNGYFNGPGIDLRRFYNWAKNPANYNQVGLPSGKLEIHGSIDSSSVAAQIPHGVDEEIWVQVSKVGYADILYWAEQWVLENYPEEAGTAWTVDHTVTAGTMTITLEDTSTHSVPVIGFNENGRYVYSYYVIVKPGEEGTLFTGDTTVISDPVDFPDTTDWDLLSTDAGPPVHRIYEKRTRVTDEPGKFKVLIETMHQFQDDVADEYSYRIDTQTNVEKEYGETLLFIYEIGSGNAVLDAIVSNTVEYGEFFPFIPIRLENEFLSTSYFPTAFAQTAKAYKKATGQKISKLIADLEDNDKLEDIDHAFVTFGVSLNTLESASKKYLFRLFEMLQLAQVGGPSAYSTWKTMLAGQQTIADEWVAWKERQDSPANESDAYEEEPTRPGFDSLPTNQLLISGTGALNSRYDVRLEWVFVEDGSGTGLGKSGAKKGDLWIEYLGEDDVASLIYSATSNNSTPLPGQIEKIRLYWQNGNSTYKFLDIVGAVHRNFVYGDNEIRITAKEALDDTDESGFIVPLHYDTWRALSLKDVTQMATACVFIQFNCYKLVKLKWYQTGVFKILAVIAVAIASVVFTGGAGIGILGTHLSVGSSLGFTGLSAAIVGSVANALAALVLITVIEQVTKDLGVLGSILSTLLMFVIGQVGAAFQNTGTLSFNWGDLLKADNLMKLTNAVGQGVSSFLNDDTMKINRDWLDYSKKMEMETKKIQQAYFEEFGYGAGVIDPFMLVDSSNGPIAESSATFLTRTLMTGSEIADMSHELLYNFPEYSLKLQNAFS